MECLSGPLVEIGFLGTLHLEKERDLWILVSFSVASVHPIFLLNLQWIIFAIFCNDLVIYLQS